MWSFGNCLQKFYKKDFAKSIDNPWTFEYNRKQESGRHSAGVADILNPIANPDEWAGGLAGNDKT